MKYFKHFFFISSKSLFVLFFIQSCIDPVEPEFDFIEDLIFIEGFATSAEKGSYVSVQKSKLEYGIYKIFPVKGCDVSFVNSITNQAFSLVEIDNFYLPAKDFTINPDEIWELKVILPSGEVYKSTPEKAPQPVPVRSLKANYKKELQTIRNTSNKDVIVSGHKITVSFDDPNNKENYYLHRYRTFEKEQICKTCIGGVLRYGECVIPENLPRYFRFTYFTYGCDKVCWNMDYNNSISIFSDEFTNGLAVDSYEIGKVPLYSSNPFYIEVQQFSITPAAHKYYKTLKDITDNTSSLNSPLPAALVGNLYNSNDKDQFVLGRFTVAGESNTNLFVERIKYGEDVSYNLSGFGYRSPYPETYGMPLPAPLTYFAPCTDTRYRTSIQPQGWINNIGN